MTTQEENGITLQHETTIITIWDANSPQTEKEMANVVRRAVAEYRGIELKEVRHVG